MPISNECLKLYRAFIENYQETGEKQDPNYSQIYAHLLDLLNTISANPQAFKDDRIISYLASSALILQDNSIFHYCCRNFLITYAQKTLALDAIVDETLNIKSELDSSWSIQSIDSIGSKQPTSSSPFFMELQKAIGERNQRNLNKQSPSQKAPQA